MKVSMIALRGTQRVALRRGTQRKRRRTRTNCNPDGPESYNRKTRWRCTTPLSPWPANPRCRLCRSVVGTEDSDILSRGGRKRSMARKSNTRVSALNSGEVPNARRELIR